MLKYVKLIILYMAILSIGSALYSKESKSTEYLKYVNEIVNDFAKHMKIKHKLHCYGSGGSMPTDVEKIEVMFISYAHLGVAEARKLEVAAVEDLLRRINSHEKIRPYLREYPFHPDRVDILISFRTKTDDYPLDGSVALMFLAKNKIFYRAAEMKMSASIPFTHIHGKNEWTTEIIPGKLEETLVPILDETYEDALKIVGVTSSQQKTSKLE